MIAGTAVNDKGSLGNPIDNMRLKPIKLIDEQLLADGGTVYSFKIPTGMSKSHYERYREGLEQYLNKNVRFAFDQNLMITVLDGPLVKYK